MIGTTIGDYRILEKRGEGGMGMFFKAQDIRLDRLVGIKTIRGELLHDPEILGKLEEEAKSLARLDHPNIARLLHYMVINEQRYIVMEFVEGSDLAETLRGGGPLSLELMSQLVPQICGAIGYAHKRNVIHRDIKPSNILITGDNTVKVTDFGIAKILGVSTKTKTGVATGSLPYMAPEQIRGTNIDARTDIYQLGVMFFELLCGRRPFLAETEYDMMSHHLSTPPPTPSSINPSMPKAVDQVLLKALAKDPSLRFASTAELAEAFRVAQTTPDDTRTVYRAEKRTTPTEIEPASSRKWPLIVVGIGVVGLIVLAKVFVFDRTDVAEQGPPNGPIQSPIVRVTGRINPQETSRRIAHSAVGKVDGAPSIATFFFSDDSLSISCELNFASTDPARITLEATDREGHPLVFDTVSVTPVIGEQRQFDVALRIIPPPVAVQEEKPPVRERPREEVSPPRETGTEGQPASRSGNLTLDVQPFAERDRIESIWVDGQKQTGQFPLTLTAAPGLRTIRWKIGSDFWTDTVTVGRDKTEKNLMFELSRGRVNVAVTFTDGPGYAEILLDGQETGQGTPGELRNVPAGPHEITLRRDGYRMQGGPHIVRVPANDRARINVRMVPQ